MASNNPFFLLCIDYSSAAGTSAASRLENIFEIVTTKLLPDLLSTLLSAV